MVVRVLITIFALQLATDDGANDGRRGNASYEAGAYAEASAAYRAGLDAHGDTPGTVATGLWNNLGAALHQQQQFDEAATAFEHALDAAVTPHQRARALYNAGNNAAAREQWQAALDFYRRALLTEPGYEDARFNYEYVKRQMAERQRQQSPSPRRIEPSDYARELKRRADTLVADQRYEAALRLMQAGLRRDSTVAAFRTFIERLGDVTDINTRYP